MNEMYDVEGVLDRSCIKLETLFQLSVSSVYCLVRRDTRMVQVYGSVNTMSHLGRTLEEIRTSGEYKNLLEDLSQIDFCILETIADQKDLKIAIGSWIDKFKESGYTLYKDCSPIRLRLETTLEHRDGRLTYCLYVVSTRSYRKLVGVFVREKDMRKFKDEHYKDNKVRKVIVHGNSIRNR